MAQILFVEDDKDLVEVVVDWLQHNGYTVEVAYDGETGKTAMQRHRHDLLVLDWELPQITGLDLCKTYRASGGSAPVLMLTGRSSIHDKESGLDSGADDYLTKPFHLKELLMRVRALLRRPPRRPE